MVDIPDVITSANFGEDRLRGLRVAGVKVCPSPLTLIVALTTLSHYRASVWCMYVIEFSIFLLISEWALQQCMATALPVKTQNDVIIKCK